MSLNPNQQQNSSFLSVQRKKQALWNVLEPGDPYDIRKSMIAKVPFDRKTFMGDHLQLVCLFQAAQIERLSQFLDDFKFRYRQIERIKLDRHSYEIQIQQLTHRLAQEAVFRQENEKLKEFLKNQNLSKQDVEGSIKTKYQKLLVQAKGFQEQNYALKQKNQQLNTQMSSFDAKFEALKKSINTEYEQKMRQSQSFSMSSQVELNSIKSQYESQVQRLDLQNKRIKQLNEDRAREVESWQTKYMALEQQMLRSSPKSEKKIAEYENRFVIFGQQIDRLNLVIRQISNKYEISEQRNHQYEAKYDALNKQMMLLQSTLDDGNQNVQFAKKITELESQNRRFQESGRFAKEYETKLRQANEQILRLGGQLRVQLENANILREEVQRYQYEQSRIKVLEKELYDYKQAAQNNNLKLKIAQDQNQVAILKQQIDRLREELSSRNGIEGKQRALMTQNQALESKLADWQRKYQMTVQEYELRVKQKVSEYQSRIENINRTKGYEYENKATTLQSELQRVSDLLRRKQQQVDNYQRQIRQLEYSITNKYELDSSRKVQNYETVIQGLKKENEEQLKRIRQLEPLQRKVNEYENRTTITSQEIQRLTQQIRSRDNDIDNLKRQIREQQIAIVQKFQLDTSKKLGGYQNILNDLNRQNQELKRKYTEMQNKTALLSQQIQRLTSNLREFQIRITQYEQEIQRLQRYSKQTEINITKKYEIETNQKITNYETVIRNNQREIQEMRRRILQLQNGNRRLVEYESQLKLAGQQIQRLNGGLRQKQQQTVHLQTNQRNLIREFEELGRKYSELQSTVRNKFQVEATRTINTLEQNLNNFKRENDQLKRFIQQYEQRVKKQGSDFEGLSLNFRNVSQENENLKRQIIELENSYRNKLEVQVTGKYRSYESNLTDVKRELQNILRENNQLKRILQNAEQTNIRLNQQNEDLRKRFQQDFGEASKRISDYETRISQLQAQNENFRRKVLELQTVIREKYEIEASRRISNLDQNLANAARQNQELRRKLQQSMRELEELRRIIQRMQRDNEELARRLREFGDINKRSIEYQNQISILTQQLKVRTDDLTKADIFIKELTQKLQNAERNMSQSQSSIQQFETEVKTRISQYQQNILIISQENTQLKRRLAILDDMNRKIAEYENKIMILNQQLQRVNINLKSQAEKSNQLEVALRNSGNENQNLRRNLIEIQNTVTQKYEVEATRTIRTLEQNFDGIQKQNAQLKKILQEYEQNLNGQNADLQKFSANLKNLSDENNQLRNQLKQTEVSIVRKYETEVNNRQSVYQKEITHLRRQNEELARKLRQFIERIVPEYENQIAILKQQIERLNQYSKQESGQLLANLKNLGQQNQVLKRQILQLQQTFTHKIQGQVNVKYSSYEQNIAQLRNQNEQLKRYIQEIGGKFDGQMKGFSQQFGLLQRENQDLKRNLQQLTFRYQSQTKKAGSFQQNLLGLGKQNEDLKRNLTSFQQQIEKLVRRINQLQQQNEFIRRQAKQGQLQVVQKFQVQTTQQINVYKQQIVQIESQWRSVQKQNEQLQRRLNDLGGEANSKIIQYEEQLKRAVAEIERLNSRIREHETKLRELIAENDGLKRQVKDTEIGISQRWQSQLRTKVMNYEQVITTLRRQNQQLDSTVKNMSKSFQDKEINLSSQAGKRIAQHQNKIALLSQELQHITQSMRQKGEQGDRMRQQIQRLNNTLRLKMQETKQYETDITKFRSSTQSQFSQLQSSYTLIARENQNYKKHLIQYENSIKKLYGEFERLQNIINDLKRERQSLFEKNFALSDEIDRLLNHNKDLEVQVEDVRLRLSDQSALSRRVNEHMALMVVLFAEIQSLRKRVKDKEKQVEDVRRSSLAPFKLDKSRPKMESI